MTDETNGPGREPCRASVDVVQTLPVPDDAIQVQCVCCRQTHYIAPALRPLLRAPITGPGQLGPCHCPPDECQAPVIMGRQTPCLRAAPPAAPPEPAADADGLLVQLRLAEEDYTVAWGRGDLYGWAADLIEQQARELAEMTIRAECAEMVCRDKDADWVTENARAKSAEADLAAARACIAAADAWRKECDADGYPRVYPDTSCGGGQGGQMLTCRTPGLIAAFDAARAAIKGTK